MQGVTLKAVGKRFGNATAVDSVSLSVAPGEFVTLLGPSGCGKTTTLRMVAGLEQNDSGVISIGDRVVSDPASGTYVAPEKRQLGMVFQSYAIWPHMTVFDNVAYPLRVRRAPAEVIRQKVHAALALVEMTDYADRPAPRLSGGQQQRVAIARAMVFEPQVLLLDEPLSNLDAKLRAQMGEEFRALQHRLRITCLYVTHDQEEAMALSDRIVVMQHGRVLQVGDPRSIYQRPTSRAVAAFFGSPNLIDAVVESCDPRSDGLYTIQVNAQGWRGSCLAGETFKIGDPVVVMIRPESLQVTLTPAAATGVTDLWRGEIIDSIFRGARCSVVVRMGHLRLVAEAPSLRAAPIGTHVCLFADATEAWALRPESHSRSHESKAGERP
jgi:iron(III) transport system ATP-binding protein